MEHVSATRTELLNRRRAALLAGQGRDVLSDKRAALVRAMQERGGELAQRLAGMEVSAATARARLDEATAALGPAAVSSASHAAAATVGVRVESSVVAGVAVVDLQHDDVRRSPDGRGYALVTSDARIGAAAVAYEQQVVELLDLVTLELTVRRLAHEIRRTTRQVNALEHVVLPRLRAQERHIAEALEEREREETARLRRARARRAGTRTAGGHTPGGSAPAAARAPGSGRAAQPPGDGRP